MKVAFFRSQRVLTALVLATLTLFVLLIYVKACHNSTAVQSSGNVQLGTAVAVEPLQDDELYAQTVRSEFEVLAVEDAMKFRFLQPSRGLHDFHRADTIVNFAEANGLQVTGHTLVWHEELPS